MRLGVCSGSGRDDGARAVSPQRAPTTGAGHPDLSGFWYFGTATPLERPRDLADKATLTEEEAAAFEERTADRLSRVVAVHPPEWLDYGTRMQPDRRTSLISDPPDGRIPALTPAARDRAAARAKTQARADNPEDRCRQGADSSRTTSTSSRTSRKTRR